MPSTAFTVPDARAKIVPRDSGKCLVSCRASRTMSPALASTRAAAGAVGIEATRRPSVAVSSARRHATRWSGSIDSSGGRASRHRGSAIGQRGAKLQPGGTFARSGG